MAAHDIDRIHAIKERAWERLGALSGVHAVGLGTKVAAGNRTDETAIVVFVVRKKSLDELDATELVPPIFEGVKTDVVEMRMPRLLGGSPISEEVTPLPSTAGGGIITLTTTSDPPAEGSVVVACVTVMPLAPGRPRRHIYQAVYTNGRTLLSALADSLAKSLNRSPLTSVNPPGTTQIIVTANSGHTATVSCSVLTLDIKKYSDDFLRGGIRIQGGGSNELGTLGCLATTAPTPMDPQGRVVAITNQHVLSVMRATNTALVARVDDQARTIEMRITPNRPSPARSLVFVGFFDEDNLVAAAFYTTSSFDTLSDVATGVVDAINNASIPGVNAVLNSANSRMVNVLGPNSLTLICDTFGSSQPDPAIHLQATVETTATLTNVITFKGQAPIDDCGVFVRVNPGGTIGTFGISMDPVGLSLNDIAQKVSTLINNLPPSVSGLVSATAVGARVIINKSEEVECTIQSSIGAGQPTNSFVWPCSHRVGRIIGARLDVDTAIVQLDPGLASSARFSAESRSKATSTSVSPIPSVKGCASAAAVLSKFNWRSTSPSARSPSTI